MVSNVSQNPVLLPRRVKVFKFCKYFYFDIKFNFLRYLYYYNLKLFLEPFIRMCFVLICRSSTHELYSFNYIILILSIIYSILIDKSSSSKMGNGMSSGVL